MTMAKS